VRRAGGRGRAAWRCAALAALLVLLPGCLLVRYSDDLVDETTGRSNFVTQPASFGGVVGFVCGLPLDLVFLPATYIVYQSQKQDGEEGLDPGSTLLFPSFVLWRTGVILIGAPFDLVEYTFYRAWQPAPPRTQSELDRGLDAPPPDKPPDKKPSGDRDA
jgi:hypothetical protein